MTDKYEGHTQTEIWLMDTSSIDEEHEALQAENKLLREALEEIAMECYSEGESANIAKYALKGDE